MKKAALALAAATLFAAGTLFSACENKGKCVLLKEPLEPQAFTYEESKSQGFTELNSAAGEFAADFAARAYSAYSGDKNFAVSPVSVFSALALAAECSAGDTQAELLSALGTDYNKLSSNYLSLYRSVFKESETALATMSNSLWLDSSVQADGKRTDALAEKYGSYSYSADFMEDNRNANLAVKHFVKEQTNGLIDKNFNFDQYTIFTLINTLYVKDTWNIFGDELKLTSDKYAFKQSDGKTKSVNLMQGDYSTIRAYDGNNFTSCYTRTYSGYSLTFIVPDEGYSIENVFTTENIAAAADADYDGTDNKAKIHYHTRCLFPSFSAEYDGMIKDTLRGMGINSLFEEYACDLSPLIPSSMEYGVYCPDIVHATALEVNRRGIEGAATTAIPGATSPGPDGYENVYLDFVVDRDFGFILANEYGTALFMGTVSKI